MLVLLFLSAWLIGGLLGAEWVGKLWPGANLREQGSGNPGASNALRVRGPAFALLVLLWDVLKAVLAVWLLAKLAVMAGVDWPVQSLQRLLGLAVVAGHLWPPFYRFKGGKGVATALGVLMVALPVVVPWVVGVWLAVFLFSGFSGLASALAALVLPLWAVLTGTADGGTALMGFCSMLAVLVLGAHKENMQRLLRGEENRYALPWLKKP